MNFLSVVATSAVAAHHRLNAASAIHPVVLQPQNLDRGGCLEFQAALHNALQSAPAVIVDFIWLEAIDAGGIAILTDALHLAARLGKSIAFQGASFAVSTALAQELDRLRSNALGHWQQQCHSEFDLFLRDRGALPEQNRGGGHSKTAADSDDAIIFPRFGTVQKIA